jgi:hypothetical protein
MRSYCMWKAKFWHCLSAIRWAVTTITFELLQGRKPWLTGLAELHTNQLWHQSPRTQDHEYQSMPMCIISTQFYLLIYIRSILILSGQLLHVHHIPDCLCVLLVSFSPWFLHFTIPTVAQGQHTSHSSLSCTVQSFTFLKTKYLPNYFLLQTFAIYMFYGDKRQVAKLLFCRF